MEISSDCLDMWRKAINPSAGGDGSARVKPVYQSSFALVSPCAGPFLRVPYQDFSMTGALLWTFPPSPHFPPQPKCPFLCLWPQDPLSSSKHDPSYLSVCGSL